jgi:hypothetical protein
MVLSKSRSKEFLSTILVPTFPAYYSFPPSSTHATPIPMRLQGSVSIAATNTSSYFSFIHLAQSFNYFARHPSGAKLVQISFLKSFIIAESRLQRDKKTSSKPSNPSHLLKHTETLNLACRLPFTSCLRHFPQDWISELSRRVRARVLDKISIQSETSAG